MPATQIYQLVFRAPLHVGERGVGLEESRAHVAADTVFSALCQMWRELYDVAELERLLRDFDNEAAQPKPFYLTSAFPFAGTLRFFPRPRIDVPVLPTEPKPKALRRVQFVSESIFEQIVNGAAPAFHSADTINDGLVWIAAAERAVLRDWEVATTGATQSETVLWRRQVVPRVTLDRLTGESSIWHCGSVLFASGAQGQPAGLWFAAQVQEEVRPRFEAALRLLGDTGLGGERGAGYGLFSFSTMDAQALSALVANDEATEYFTTLAPCCPANKEEAESLVTGPQVSYELLPRRGWVGSVEAGTLRRKQVWMFGEGAVLGGTPRFAGQLVDVKPEPSRHEVRRYGLAFPVGVKLS
jgi:CRISPR-associated protein Csm4